VYADDHLLPWFRSLVGGLPGVRLFDAHTHLGGDDPDGWRCAPDELTDAVSLVDGRAAVFPLMERAGYRDANDSVLAAATASQGRLIPFCRVNPRADPVGELERCLAADLIQLARLGCEVEAEGETREAAVNAIVAPRRSKSRGP
jgi:hypothetical protein